MSNAEHPASSGAGLETLIRSYLEAFEARDLDHCLSYFADDAVINFQSGAYRGLKMIADWHRDRFAAELKIDTIESITVDEDMVIVDAVISSKRLAAWKINSVNGRVTIHFESGKIKQGKLAPRMMNPFDLLRSGQ